MTRDELIDAMARAMASRTFGQGALILRNYSSPDIERGYGEKAKDALSAIEAAGFAVVPVEATDEQIDAIRTALRTTRISSVSVMSVEGQYMNENAREFAAYRAMIEAGKL